MVHSRGVSSVQAAAAEPPVARRAGTGVLAAACVSALVLLSVDSAGAAQMRAVTLWGAASAADALAAGLSRAALLLTLFSAGILLIVLLRGFRARRPQAAAAVTTHTIPAPQEP